MNIEAVPRMSRRDAMKWIMAATGTAAFLSYQGLEAKSMPAGERTGRGYGLDPNLLEGKVPWERILNAAQLKLTAVLADIILPHVDSTSPSASAVYVPDFIDEWISAPYPNQQRDRKIILNGFAWIDKESNRRYGKSFVELNETEACAICDGICHSSKAAPELAEGARFFTAFRGLTLGGYYTTAIGMRDAGYVGNIPLVSFEGPPPVVLKRLGIERAPW